MLLILFSFSLSLSLFYSVFMSVIEVWLPLNTGLETNNSQTSGKICIKHYMKKSAPDRRTHTVGSQIVEESHEYLRERSISPSIHNVNEKCDVVRFKMCCYNEILCDFLHTHIHKNARFCTNFNERRKKFLKSPISLSLSLILITQTKQNKKSATVNELTIFFPRT